MRPTRRLKLALAAAVLTLLRRERRAIAPEQRSGRRGNGRSLHLPRAILLPAFHKQL